MFSHTELVLTESLIIAKVALPNGFNSRTAAYAQPVMNYFLSQYNRTFQAAYELHSIAHI